MNENTEYLQDLNTEQKEAATHTEGPLLILAGAGAGKTKTITYRILHLIKKGIEPQKILAITFTNKAAKEMRERVLHLLETDRGLNIPISSYGIDGGRFKSIQKPFVSTFHSLAVHILKESGQHIDVPKNFVIFDRNDTKQVIKDALVELGHDPKKIEPSKILSIISREKGNFVSLEEFEAQNADEYIGSIAAEVWKKYDATLKKEKALDFDDLLFKATKLLAINTDVREKYQNMWTYVHVDEYQDTNQVQYRLVQLIVGNRENIAVVGDADQSIYGWRGADIRNILRFEEDYPNAKTILLEQNYRSTQTILSAANTIIEKNIYRKKKNLYTKNEEGGKIKIFTAYDEAAEANFVANTVRELLHDEKVNPNQIAVLFRANFQSRVLEEAFLRKTIPYTLLGTRFFERKEVKDALSYIRAAINPESLSDIKRIINTPTRGIGKTTVLKILEGRERDLPSATLLKVNNFRNILREIRKKIDTQKASEVVKYTLLMSGLEHYFTEEGDDERLENIKELVTLATKFDSEEFTPPLGIEKLLEEASLASDQDDLDRKVHERDANKDTVKLMTVHASKGLEFDYVFITGLEQELFPHARMQNENMTPEQSEEERRLFYVALTRARKQLYLSHANVRTIFGNKNVTIPSEFISDIDDDLVEKEDPEPVSGIKSIFIDF